jgi:hypothetical protein
MRKLSRAAKRRHIGAAARQRAYRKRQKDRRKPSTEDIAITSMHHFVTTGRSPDAKRHFSVLTDQIIGKLVYLGFDPIASRMAFDDLVDRYEAGELLTRGPNNNHGGPDISAFLPKPNQSPHNSMSRGDTENLGVDANALVVREAVGASSQFHLCLSTAHVSSTDLELLLEEVVFGLAFDVCVKETALDIPIGWLEASPEVKVRQRIEEGYSKAFCEVLLLAQDLGADVLRLASDGYVCGDLSLFEGTNVVQPKPLGRLSSLVD